MRIVAFILWSGLAYGQVTSSSMTPAQPATKSTARTDRTAPDVVVDANTLLPEMPAPAGKPALVGGTISNIDRVNDELTVRPFGGAPMRVLFDGRTLVWRNGVKVSTRELRAGEKAYVDTVLDGSSVFAKSVRVLSQGTSGEARGQVVSFDPSRGELTLNDGLSPQPFKVRILPGTKVMRNDRETSTNLLQPGTLVVVAFSPGQGTRVAAQQVTVVAEPGTSFAYIGRVMALDLRAGTIVVMDPRDKKTYEIRFDPGSIKIDGDLQLGSEVIVEARFDGTHYATNAIKVSRSAD